MIIDHAGYVGDVGDADDANDGKDMHVHQSIVGILEGKLVMNSSYPSYSLASTYSQLSCFTTFLLNINEH